MKKLLLWVGVCVLVSSAVGQVPPPATTPLTRNLLRTNFTTANFRDALGFLTTNNTVITNYVGNGASITNLNADELRSGTVPLARLSGITASQIANDTITTGKVDSVFYELLTNAASGGGSGDVTAAGLAAFVAERSHILYVSASGDDSTATRGDITKPWQRLYDFDGTNRLGACGVATNGDTIVVIGTNMSAFVPLNDGVTLKGYNSSSAVFFTNRMAFTNDLMSWKTNNGNYATGPDHPMFALSAGCVVRDLFIDARDGSYVTNTPFQYWAFISPFASGVGHNNLFEQWVLDNDGYHPSPYESGEYPLLGFTNRPGPGMQVLNCRVWANVDVVYFNFYGFYTAYYSSTNDPAYDGGYDGTFWGPTEEAMTWTTNTYIAPRVELYVDRATRFDSYWDYMVVSGGNISVTFNGEAHVHGLGAGIGASKGPAIQIYNDGMYYDGGIHYLAYTTNRGAGSGLSIVGGPAMLQGSVFYNSNAAAYYHFNTPSLITGYFQDGVTGTGHLMGGIDSQTSYAAGSAYTLTASAAQLNFGTTDPSITVTNAGTYAIRGSVSLKFNAATYAAAQTATIKFRRTNNTAADLSGGSVSLTLPVLTTYTGGDVVALPEIQYTAAAGDIIQMFGSLSATPSVGSITAEAAHFTITKIR